MTRYIDLLNLTEAVRGLHCPIDADLPNDWMELPQDHWFWQPLPAGYRVGLVDGSPALLEITDERSIEDLQTTALAVINAQADIALKPITDLYPRSEIDSWSVQSEEAAAWLADQRVSTVLVDAITGPIGLQEKVEFCNAILNKADEYKAAVGVVIAWRRACTAWVDVQTDREQLISYVPKYPEVPHG